LTVLSTTIASQKGAQDSGKYSTKQ